MRPRSGATSSNAAHSPSRHPIQYSEPADRAGRDGLTPPALSKADAQSRLLPTDGKDVQLRTADDYFEGKSAAVRGHVMRDCATLTHDVHAKRLSDARRVAQLLTRRSHACCSHNAPPT